MSHCAEKFRSGILYCCSSFGHQKSLDKKGGNINIFRRNFFSHCAEVFCGGILYGCNNFGSRRSLEKRGVIKTLVEDFLSHSAENFRRRILYCCINFGSRKSLDKGGGEYPGLLSKFFCLTVPKISVGESFIAALVSGTDKVWIRRRGVSRFSVEVFLSHCAEKFRRGILYCCSSFGHQKSLDRKGGNINIFRRKFFVSQCRKFL